MPKLIKIQCILANKTIIYIDKIKRLEALGALKKFHLPNTNQKREKRVLLEEAVVIKI